MDAISVDFAEDNFHNDNYPRRNRHNASVESAHALGRKIDTMKGKQRVQFINFALLQLKGYGDKSTKVLGEGSFSTVIKGKYQSHSCAIKLIGTRDVTVHEISKVASEATLLSLLTSPNVVKIFGITVLPPRVGIVLEFCSFGSLSDLLRGGPPDQNGKFRIDHSTMQSPNLRLASSSSSDDSMREGARGPATFVPLSIVDRLYLALGCAKGLLALHNYSRNHALVHRDIKSFNFLVDGQLNAKLADLELSTDSLAETRREQESSTSNSPLRPNRSNVISIFRGKSVDEDNYDADMLLSNWIAPEVLRGGTFTQAADVYSLALVLWEIITNKVPYANTKVQSKFALRDMIIHGHRPEIPANICSQPYAQLIRQGWNEDPFERPTASDMVNILTEIWIRYRSIDLEGGRGKTIHSFFSKLNKLLDDKSGDSGNTLRLSDFTNPTNMTFPETFPIDTTKQSQILKQLKDEHELFMKEIRGMEQHVYVDGNLVKKAESFNARFREQQQQQEEETVELNSFSSKICQRLKSCSLKCCQCKCFHKDDNQMFQFGSSGGLDVKRNDSSDMKYFHPLSTIETDAVSPFYNLTYPTSKPPAKSSKYFELISLHTMFEAKPDSWNCIRDHVDPVLLLSGKPPYVIVTCSIVFEKLLGFTSSQLFGKCLEHLLDINDSLNCERLEIFYESIQQQNDDEQSSRSVLSPVSSPHSTPCSSPPPTSQSRPRSHKSTRQQPNLPKHTGHVVLTLLDYCARLQDYSLHAIPVYERKLSTTISSKNKNYSRPFLDGRTQHQDKTSCSLLKKSFSNESLNTIENNHVLDTSLNSSLDSTNDVTTRQSITSVGSSNSSSSALVASYSNTTTVAYYTVTVHSLSKVPLTPHKTTTSSTMKGINYSSSSLSSNYDVDDLDDGGHKKDQTTSSHKRTSITTLLQQMIIGRVNKTKLSPGSDDERFSDVAYGSTSQGVDLYDEDDNYSNIHGYAEV